GDHELWRTSGTADDIRLVSNVNRLGVGSNPRAGFSLNGWYFFFANDGDLYRTDGTSQGTMLVRAGIGPFNNLLDSVAILNGKAYFSGRDPASGFSAGWQTDGTPAGTVPFP